MGIGRASGENRAKEAARQAIESPLIEVKIDGARGVLFSVAGGYDMSMSEIQEAAEEITGAVSPDANIIFGAQIRPELQEEIVITVVATGFGKEERASVGNSNSGRILETVRSNRQVETPKPVQQVVNAPVANNNEEYSDIPAILRNNNNDDHNFPAFLRRGKK